MIEPLTNVWLIDHRRKLAHAHKVSGPMFSRFTIYNYSYCGLPIRNKKYPLPFITANVPQKRKCCKACWRKMNDGK